jgi:hypothetical protein
MVTFFIFMNVFVAVIYEEFINVKETDESLNLLSLKKSDIEGFVETWSHFDPQGSHYIRTLDFPKFLRALHAPLGYRGVMIEDSKLNKIIFCLNIRDRQGFVYFPEVMWAIFYTIVGNNEAGIAECLPVKNIMQRLRNNYKALGRNTSLEALCGNRYYKNEMTVTKYLSGMLIKRQIELIMKRRQQAEGKAEEAIKGIHQSGHTHTKWPRGPLHHLYLALVRKPKIIEEQRELCESYPGGNCADCHICNVEKRTALVHKPPPKQEPKRQVSILSNKGSSDSVSA